MCMITPTTSTSVRYDTIRYGYAYQFMIYEQGRSQGWAKAWGAEAPQT